MTVVSDAYDGLRAAGFDHRRAVSYLARQFGLDDSTMHRVLVRADRGPWRDVSAPLGLPVALRPSGPVATDPAAGPHYPHSRRRRRDDDDSTGALALRLAP